MTAILGTDGKPLQREQLSARPRNRINAHYDGAQTSTANANYWASADSLSARAAHSPAVRKVIRERARYEVGNNCYAKGMLRTQADYVIGTGPRLQLLTEDKEFNRGVTRLFYEWAESVQFARKLWTMRFAWGVDGEAFAEFVNNDRSEHPVTLDLMLLETDQISDGYGEWNLDQRREDGVILDKFGNIVGYRKLPYHPGDQTWWTYTREPEVLQKRDVIHLYRLERPGQLRGVSEIAPALMLYPGLRRWTYAALSTAEKNARIYGVIKSNYSPADIIAAGNMTWSDFRADSAAPQAMDAFELEADTLLTMPDGWDMNAYKSEQPSTTYPMFKREIVSEMARCLNMPFGIAAADSSTYNFASGKLDLMPWGKSIAIDQLQVSEVAATPVFRRWYYEARRIPGYLPFGPPESAAQGEYVPPHIWQWDGQRAIDPREAMSKATLVEYGLSNFAREYAERGYDVDEEHEAQSKSLGMTVDEYRAALRMKLFGVDPLAPAPQPEAAPMSARDRLAAMLANDRTEQEVEDALAS